MWQLILFGIVHSVIGRLGAYLTTLWKFPGPHGLLLHVGSAAQVQRELLKREPRLIDLLVEKAFTDDFQFGSVRARSSYFFLVFAKADLVIFF